MYFSRDFLTFPLKLSVLKSVMNWNGNHFLQKNVYLSTDVRLAITKLYGFILTFVLGLGIYQTKAL